MGERSEDEQLGEENPIDEILTEELLAEEETEDDAEEEAPVSEVTGDDIFDQEPVFGNSRFALPNVQLPQGEASTLPGDSGVVAIFCPEEFTNEDKAAECAGRREIRSGWRPGASGENWDEAIRLLKQQQAEGVFNDPNTVTFGPEIAREADRRRRQEDLENFGQSQDDLNNLPDNQNNGVPVGRPNVGPPEFTPSWTLREDPDISQRDLDKLENDLEEAAQENE